MKIKFSTSNFEKDEIIRIFSGHVNEYVKELKVNRRCKNKRKKCHSLCKSQSNSLIIILGIYVVIFSVASVVLILSLLKVQNIKEKNQNDSITFKNFHLNESYNVRNNFFTLNSADKLLLKKVFKNFKWPFRSLRFKCSNLSDVKKFKYLASGWTKNVFSFDYMNKSYALKTVNFNGKDIKSCMETHNLKNCFEKGSSKIYKEYILSMELLHKNILKVWAWCVSSNDFFNEVAIVTELCTPIDLILLLRMSFLQRLKIMVDLSELMVYLAHSPLGSVAINDFQRQQFVLCGNTLKLADLDDLSIEEPKCNDSNQCTQQIFLSNIKENKSVHELKCVQNLCLGYNEKKNVINVYKHFVNLFLNITAPIALQQSVNDLLYTYTSTWNARIAFQLLKDLYFKCIILKI